MTSSDGEPQSQRLEYVKVGNHGRCCQPVLRANNKIKPHGVYVKVVAKQHPEGNYYMMRLDGQLKMLNSRKQDASCESVPARRLEAAGR